MTASLTAAPAPEAGVPLDALNAATLEQLIRELADSDPADNPWSGALCAETNPEAFFPEQGGNTAEAKKLCAKCPVMDQCREEALANDERYGIWGGLTPNDRARILRERASEEREAC